MNCPACQATPYTDSEYGLSKYCEDCLLLVRYWQVKRGHPLNVVIEFLRMIRIYPCSNPARISRLAQDVFMELKYQ